MLLDATSQFRAFSASKIQGTSPGALPQAFTFRAFGAGTRGFDITSELLGYYQSSAKRGLVELVFVQTCSKVLTNPGSILLSNEKAPLALRHNGGLLRLFPHVPSRGISIAEAQTPDFRFKLQQEENQFA